MNAVTDSEKVVLPRSGTGAQAQAPEVDGRTWIAIYAAILGVFMAILDIQVTNASLREIRGSLSATQEEGSWMTTAYLAAEVIAIPLTAFFVRVFGARVYMVGNSALFLLFSTLCGYAWNLPSMIIFRALQGFTGGALIPTAMTLILTRLPAHKRAGGLAWLMLASTIAPAFGPTLGGILTNFYGWPSIFFINWGPGVLMVAGLAYGLGRDKLQLSLLREADWQAIGAMAVGLGSLIVFLEEGNSKDWFASPLIRASFVLAAAGIVAWVALLLKRSKPFVNLGLFARRTFGVSSLVGAAAGMGLYGSTFVLPLFLSEIAGYNTLRIGEVIMWMGLPQIVMMPVAAVLAKRFDNRVICTAGLLLFAASCFMNARMDASTGHDQLVMSQVLRALGQPLIVLTLSNFAIHRVELPNLSSASSLYNMSRILGGAVGTAILATTITLREHLHSARIGESVSLFSNATHERLDQLSAGFVLHSGDAAGAQQQAVAVLDRLVRRESYVMAYNDCFFILGCVLLVSIAAIWLADRVVAQGK
jgi:DHA2 family multidrug resistance protein